MLNHPQKWRMSPRDVDWCVTMGATRKCERESRTLSDQEVCKSQQPCAANNLRWAWPGIHCPSLENPFKWLNIQILKHSIAHCTKHVVQINLHKLGMPAIDFGRTNNIKKDLISLNFEWSLSHKQFMILNFPLPKFSFLYAMSPTKINLFGIVHDHVKVDFILLHKMYVIPSLGRFIWTMYVFSIMWLWVL